ETVREALQRWSRDAPDSPAQRDGDEPIPGPGLTQEPDGSAVPPAEGASDLTQQPGRGPVPMDPVSPSPVRPADRSRCPACSALITAKDERCPCCDISFISDGSHDWTLSAVGPADGICLPPSEVGE